MIIWAVFPPSKFLGKAAALNADASANGHMGSQGMTPIDKEGSRRNELVSHTGTGAV
jgi:hypothetical protein